MAELPLYVHSHHKCATRWQIAYLEAVARLNGLTFAAEDSPFGLRRKGADILLFGNSVYPAAEKLELAGPHVIRNPLSIVESAYWSHRNSHPADKGSQLERQKAIVRDADPDAGRYLTLTFLAAGAYTPLGALQAWKYEDERFPTVRMEDLVRGPGETFRALMAAGQVPELRLPEDEAFRFERFSGGRKVGEVAESSHYRSGTEDSWTALPLPLIRYVVTHLGSTMDRYPEVAAYLQRAGRRA